jgi:hypothetical protein
MTILTPVVLAILVAQAPAAIGGPARYQVTIESRGVVWGSATETNGTCPKAGPGSDKLIGIVEGIEPAVAYQTPGTQPCTRVPCMGADDEDVVYEGRLWRETSVDLCEVKTTADGDEWCVGHLTSAGGWINVKISVPTRGADNAQINIQWEPEPSLPVSVAGHCSTLDNAAEEEGYRDHGGILFETSDDPQARVPGTGRLVAGTVTYQLRIPPRLPGGEYTLKVEHAP